MQTLSGSGFATQAEIARVRGIGREVPAAAGLGAARAAPDALAREAQLGGGAQQVGLEAEPDRAGGRPGHERAADRGREPLGAVAQDATGERAAVRRTGGAREVLGGLGLGTRLHVT